MRMLQQNSHPSFEIHLEGEEGENLEFQRPNFYQETLHPSPVKRPPETNFYPCSDDYEEGSPSKVYVYDDDDFVEIDVSSVKQEPQQDEYRHWEQSAPMHEDERDVKPYVETIKMEPDFTTDVKFDETTQFSEPDYPPHAASPDSLEDVPASKSPRHKQQPDDSTPPVMVPKHLPRRQQELFKRVLQHQRQNAASGSDSETQESKPKEVPEIKKEQPEPEKFAIHENEWYTSEEEDEEEEEDDGQLLKKIQQAPPKPLEPAKPPAKVDLLAIFNTIQQKTLEKNKGQADAQQKSTFWQNILGGVTASKTAAAAKEKSALLSPTPAESSKPLLPNPLASPTQSPAEPIKDPRLKNRDPRKIARETTELSIPKPSAIMEELTSPPIKVTSITDHTKESIPYKLRGITAKPPNYTPYLTATQSNPSLLKDPRLRKHLQSNDPVNGTDSTHSRVDPAHSKVDSSHSKSDSAHKPVAPPIPELLLKYEKPVSAINIFETSEKSDSKPSINVAVTYDPSDKKKVPVPIIPLLESKPVPYDPVVTKSIPLVPYDPVVSKSVTPVSQDPLVTKPITNAPYEPVLSKSVKPVSYDPLVSKGITSAPYDPSVSKTTSYEPVISKSFSHAPYDPVIPKSINSTPYDPLISNTAPYDPVISKHIFPASYDPLMSKAIKPVLHETEASKSTESVPIVTKSTESGSKSVSSAPVQTMASKTSTVVKDSLVSKPPSTLTNKTSTTVASKKSKSPSTTDSKVAKPTEPKKRKHIPVSVLEPKRSSPIPKIELPELFKVDPIIKKPTPELKKVEPAKKSAPELSKAEPSKKSVSELSKFEPAKISKRRESGSSSKKRKSTSLDSTSKRRDSIASISSCDTPPHLTIVDNATTPEMEHSLAPVLESEIKKETSKKKPLESEAKEKTEKKKPLPKTAKAKKAPAKKSSTIPPPVEIKEKVDNIKKEIVEKSTDNGKEIIEEESIDNIKKEIVEESIDSIRKELVEESASIKKQIFEESIDNVEEESIDNILKEINESPKPSQKPVDHIEESIDNILKEINEVPQSPVKKSSDSIEESIDNILKEIQEPTSPKPVDTIGQTIDNVLKETESDSDNSNPAFPEKPVVEEFMTVVKKELPQDGSGDSKTIPPLIIKKVKPVSQAAASHLPVAIADPRMAKLHNPRRRAASTISPRRSTGRRKAAIQAEAAIEAEAAFEAVREDGSPEMSPKQETRSSPTKAKAKDKPKSIPKKRRLSDKTEEKKKATVHRNRKSSMDYASPLHSCDAPPSTEDAKAYNRYNQRPKRGASTAVSTAPGKSSPTSDSGSVPEFALSDSSNLECDNSSDVNLKDKFKTIDPTASPFC